MSRDLVFPSYVDDGSKRTKADVARDSEMRHLFVSNRSPYLYHEAGSSLKASKVIGGLVSTMEPAFRRLGGLWIGSSDGSSERVHLVAGENELPRCLTKSVNLSDQEVELYYNGFANGTLWPLCHSFLDTCRFSPAEWQAYERVNRKFAGAIAKELSPSHDVVWIHDYHLALTPQFVREESTEARIASFWHIPFPEPQIFIHLPWRRRILEGLLHSRFIGFHLNSYVTNFLRCVEREFAEAIVDYETGLVRVGKLKSLVRAVPLGIDYNYWDLEARSPYAWEVANDLRSTIKAETLALAVDRLDYTKGVVERIQALECLFKRREDLIGRFTLVQIGVPTRTGVPIYRDYLDRVVQDTKRVNDRFATNGWKPVVLKQGMISQKHLAGLYRATDLAVVTPLRDGMNLVAKEFVASRVDDDGVLVLSRSAGVAEELTEAVLVDPRDPEETAGAIERALALPQAERQRRMRVMRDKVGTRNLFWWLRSICEQIHTFGGHRYQDTHDPRIRTSESDPREVYSAATAQSVLLMLDFDGTLVPIMPRPEDVHVDDELVRLLEALDTLEGVRVVVLSGRPMVDLEQKFAASDVGLVASHGGEWRLRGQAYRRETLDPSLSRRFSEIERNLQRRLHRWNGCAIERKPFGIALHSRGASESTRQRAIEEFLSAVSSATQDGRAELLWGKAVVETRAALIDKGTAVLQLLSQSQESCLPVYIGDDQTDEDAFRALRGVGITARVGPRFGSTEAQYRTRDPGTVRVFLKNCLAEWTQSSDRYRPLLELAAQGRECDAS